LNLLGHAHVALARDDDPDFVLGALLPDLASMARVRLTARSLLDPSVERGVVYHLRTDAVFHTLPGFVEGSALIRRELLARGLSRGAARAVGHVGWELLLDGTLVGSPAEAAFHTALDRADTAATAVDRPERWTHLLSYRPQLRQLRYDDPAWVAERLERIFHDRPLLRFEPAQLPVVADVLTAHAPSIAAAAPSILSVTATAVG
jgi:hypothetical protein